jgi:hypothetical protein
VLEFAFEIEHGAQSSRPTAPSKTTLYGQNPLLFWQGLCVLLFIALMFALARR